MPIVDALWAWRWSLIVVANSLGYNYAPNNKNTITKILKIFLL
jgi:hypothetical protein